MTWPFLIKILLGIAGVLLVAYLLVCLALLIGQNRLIFLPVSRLAASPGDVGLKYEEVWIPVKNPDGEPGTIHGWWLPGNSDKVMLYLHGNGGNISYNLPPLPIFHELGFSTLIIDYRGYGRSQGAFPTETAVYRDAGAAWDYLTVERSIDPANIFIYGHSLGGAIAIDLAVRQPQAAGVIVDNTFTSLRAMVDLVPLYRFFPADLLLTQRFDSLAKLKILRVPLLIFHGTNDTVIPYNMARVLYDRATVPKKLVLIEGAGHNDLVTTGGEFYKKALIDFIALARQQGRDMSRHYR